MSDLAIPDNWIFASLLDVAELFRGVTYSRDDAVGSYREAYIAILRANNITDRGFRLDDLVYVPRRLVLEDQQLQIGDVVIATSSGSVSVVGKAQQVIAPIDAAFGAFCGLLRPSSELHARYFGHFFGSAEYRNIASSKARGVNINNLKRSDFESILLPLPPYNEQKRIADKLDILVARVDACRERLDRIPAILKRFRQSVLFIATSESLSEEKKNRTDWVSCTLGDVITDIRYGTAKKCFYEVEEGVPVLRIPNIGAGDIDPTDLKYGVFDDSEQRSLSLQSEDLLLIRSNGSLDLVGKVALVEPQFAGFMFAGYLIRLRADRSIALPQYLRLCLTSPKTRNYIELTARSTSGVNNVNSEELRSIALDLPSLEEQAEIVRRVEILFAFADHLENHLQIARTAIDRITPALLAKAFRGELVPQDPNDEPAAVLLERIQAVQTNSPSKKSIPKKSSPAMNLFDE